MKPLSAELRERFASARVAHLATADEDGVPHVVPVTCAVVADRIYWAVDHKPKQTNDLKRLRNLAANPAASIVADHYEEDWTMLWWVRADGTGRVVEEGDERAAALEALAAKYPQYRDRAPEGPVVAIDITRWSGWTGS